MAKLTTIEFGQFLMDTERHAKFIDENEYKVVKFNGLLKAEVKEDFYVVYITDIWTGNYFDKDLKFKTFGFFFRDMKTFVAVEPNYYISQYADIPQEGIVDDITYTTKEAILERFMAADIEHGRLCVDNYNGMPYEANEYEFDDVKHYVRTQCIAKGFEYVRDKIMAYGPSHKIIINDYHLQELVQDEKAFCKDMFEKYSLSGDILRRVKWQKTVAIQHIDELVKDEDFLSKIELYKVLEASDAKSYMCVVETDDKTKKFEFKVDSSHLKAVVREYSRYISNYDLSPADRKLWKDVNYDYEKNGAYSDDVCWHNIVEVKYRGKTIWKRSNGNE